MPRRPDALVRSGTTSVCSLHTPASQPSNRRDRVPRPVTSADSTCHVHPATKSNPRITDRTHRDPVPPIKAAGAKVLGRWTSHRPTGAGNVPSPSETHPSKRRHGNVKAKEAGRPRPVRDDFRLPLAYSRQPSIQSEGPSVSVRDFPPMDHAMSIPRRSPTRESRTGRTAIRSLRSRPRPRKRLNDGLRIGRRGQECPLSLEMHIHQFFAQGFGRTSLFILHSK